jgi:Uma2 family endonuclease
MVTNIPELALRSHQANWNYKLWESLPEDGNRYEIIDGVLYMTTAPSSFHQWIVRRLDRFVGIPLEDRQLAFVFTAPIGVLMPGCDPVQPDFLAIRRDNAGIIANRRIRGAPDLVVEILSLSHPEQDTQIKRHAYAQAGVAEYWIVRPQQRDVLLCTLPEALLGDYTHSQLCHDQLVSTVFPITLTVADLFVGAPDTTV